jgi:ankyrin repeat protein
MKTQPKTLTKSTLYLFSFILLLSTVGCNENETQKTQAKEISTMKKSQSERVAAPKIDLHTAVITNNIEAINQHIIAGSDLNPKDPFGGSSPLITAALFGKTEIVEILLEAGADINFKNNDGSTALITAAFFCRPEIVKLLLANDADKSTRNAMGATAYESVIGDFNTVKPAYDMLGQSLAPMGLVLDYDQLEKTRPIIAEMLK